MAVACWHVFGALMSVRDELSGQPWGPVFYGIKFGVLAVVVGVDVAVAVVAMRARPRAQAARRAGEGRVASPGVGAAWLVLATARYVLSWYFLAGC